MTFFLNFCFSYFGVWNYISKFKPLLVFISFSRHKFSLFFALFGSYFLNFIPSNWCHYCLREFKFFLKMTGIITIYFEAIYIPLWLQRENWSSDEFSSKNERPISKFPKTRNIHTSHLNLIIPMSCYTCTNPSAPARCDTRSVFLSKA